MKQIGLSAFCILIAVSAQAAPKPDMSGADRDKAALDTICSADVSAGKNDEADKRDQNYVDLLGSQLLLGDDQKAKLKDYRDTQIKALADAKSRLCDHKPDVGTLPGALDFRKAVLKGQLDAMDAVNPKLIDFYNSLNSEQKTKFDAMRANFGKESMR